MSKKPLSDLPPELNSKIERLKEINSDYVVRHKEQELDLERYKEKHPTKILVFKCMDGRILFSSFTETPLGFLRNFRNLGGQFNFGWVTFRNILTAIVERCYAEKRGCLAIVTYHFSEGDKKRGCAGYGYDKDASIKGAMGLKAQLERAYQGLPHDFFPIVVGIETDEDALTIHHDDKKLELASLPADISEHDLFAKLTQLYDDMPRQMRLDLLPLLMGNVRHIAKIRETSRPVIEMTHGEWIVGLGGASAFDFLHVPNTAIIVGQYNPNLDKVVEQAFKVIKSHWKPGDYFLSLAAASYGRTSMGMVYEQHAMEDVRYYRRLLLEVAHKHFPELVPYTYFARILVNSENEKMKFV